jgi:predicted GTPase
MGEKRIRTIIMGAAGRDFHNFNLLYREDPRYEVVAFTAAQIPNIAGRKYPASLAGPHYPEGIPIWDEKDLEKLIQEHDVEEAVFAYTDVSYRHVMSMSSRVTSAGAHFVIVSAPRTMLKSTKPVISVCAVRTGSGKSQTSRKIARMLKDKGFNVAVVRHPMPYGNLEKQTAQRFASVEDFKKHDCTIEEMEEYEPHISAGLTVFAGVDYKAILDWAEKEADFILWDGGNNDTPFYQPDLHIVVTDPLRPGHGLAYYPGETNPPIFVDEGHKIEGKRVLVIEDGPTLTHGGMQFGAGVIAAQKYGASEIIDPRPYVTGEIKRTFETYPEIGSLLPAMGYGEKQIKDLETTIEKVPCDLVVIATPVDLARIVRVSKPALRVRYELQEIGEPNLEGIVGNFLKERGKA